MKNNVKILAIIVMMFMFSCSDYKMRISTENNFEIINLPDGSIAYLNVNSFIEYDKSFTQRIIKQKGEVYYNVVKGETPFFVKTEKGEIQVLGTKFNVRSTQDELEVEVDEGNVEIKINEIINEVKRGQKALFKEGENQFKIYNADFKHKKWIKSLKKDFRHLGKEFDKSYRQIEKQSKKSWKKVNKELSDM